MHQSGQARRHLLQRIPAGLRPTPGATTSAAATSYQTHRAVSAALSAASHRSGRPRMDTSSNVLMACSATQVGARDHAPTTAAIAVRYTGRSGTVGDTGLSILVPFGGPGCSHNGARQR